jgi:hypothetical protein
MRAAFKGQDVVFISATDEPQTLVEGFLRSHPLTGWIALDQGGRLAKAFGVRGIPEAFIVDAQGQIRLKITPSFLYQSDIEKVLKADARQKKPRQ